MNNLLIFILFSLIEYLLTLIITNNINNINNHYISLKYTSFNFSSLKETATGLNNIIKIFFPIIYIIILSGILYELELNILVHNIYLVTLFYYLIKWFIIIVILNRNCLIDWKNEFKCFLISIILSWFIYFIFISKTTEIFVSIEEIRDGIWLGILTFFLTLIIKGIHEKSYLNISKQNEKIESYVLKKYNKFTSKYKTIIRTNNKQIKNLTYAIMIYENYNRPIIIRLFEYVKLFVTGQSTLGIMQITSNKFITDKDSVELGYKMIKNLYYSINKKVKLDRKIKKILFIYNRSDKYVEEVTYIYNLLNNM